MGHTGTAIPPFGLIRSHSIRLLLVFLCIFGLLIHYGKTHFYRDPGSVFYDEERAFTRQYTDYRQVEAEEFIQKQALIADDFSEAIKAGEKPTICVNFATVKRNGEQYIDKSLASALTGLSHEERQDLYLSVFFANTDPDEHPSYSESWIHKVADSVYTHSKNNTAQFTDIQNLEQAGNYHAKGVFDYVYGLKHCYDTGTPYVLMFEGDVMIADGWFVNTMKSVRDAQEQLRKSTRKWLYMRLFNQERSMGWGSKRIGSHNEHWISLGLIAAFLFIATVFRRRTQADTWTLIIVCFLIIPSLVVLFFQAGKASMLPPKPGVFAQGYGCCSQALLYPREQIPGLIGFLREEGEGQVDLMVNTHAIHQNLTRLSMYPVQVQHVGIESIRGTRKDEAKAIWSMAYEDKNPEKLKNEHNELLRQIYPGSDES